MSEEFMKTSEIAALLGYSSLGSVRRWVIQYALEAQGRDLDSGEKQYRRADVLAAKARMPGKGARTDLRSQPSNEGRTNGNDGPDT